MKLRAPSKPSSQIATCESSRFFAERHRPGAGLTRFLADATRSLWHFGGPPTRQHRTVVRALVIDIGVNSVKVLATGETVIRLWNDIRPGLD